MKKILTTQEHDFCNTAKDPRTRVNRVASRVAAKEAVLKALGTGIAMLGHAEKGSWWTDVEVIREEKEPPRIQLSGLALVASQHAKVQRWLISLTHDGDYAMAVTIGLSS